MSDELDPALEAKFHAVASAPPPDNWGRIQQMREPTPAPQRARARVLVAVAASLLVIGAVAAISATRQRGTPDALPSVGEPPSCLRLGEGPRLGDCVVADWDATSVTGDTVEIDYFVNPGCFDPFVGVQIEEGDSDVVLTVLVGYTSKGDQGTASCGTAVAQRHRSVQLEAALGGRTLRGCRNGQTSVPRDGYNDRGASRDDGANCNPPKDVTSVATTQPDLALIEERVSTTLLRPQPTEQVGDVEEAQLVRIEDLPFVRVAAIGRWEHQNMWVDNSAEGLCFGHNLITPQGLSGSSCVVGPNPDFQFVSGVGPFGQQDSSPELTASFTFISSRFVEMRLLDSGQELCRASATAFDGAPEIVGFLCTSESFELVQNLTYRFVDQDQVLWELDTSVSSLGPIQPIINPEVCTPTQARTRIVDGITLFARSDTHAIPIQVIADPALGPAGPFAIVERFYETIHAPSGGEAIGVDGLEARVNVYDNGNGQVTWDLPDGTQGYIRSRGLDRAQLEGIVRSLVPYDVESDRLGFDVVSEQFDPRFRYLAKQLNTEVQGEVHRSVCLQKESQNVYRTAAAEGDVVLQYAMVIDQLVPLDVRVVDGMVVTLSGRDAPTAPTIDDVVNAADAEWIRLLAQPDELAVETAPQIPIGAGLDQWCGSNRSAPRGRSLRR